MTSRRKNPDILTDDTFDYYMAVIDQIEVEPHDDVESFVSFAISNGLIPQEDALEFANIVSEQARRGDIPGLEPETFEKWDLDPLTGRQREVIFSRGNEWSRGRTNPHEENPYPKTGRSGVITYRDAHPSGTPVAPATKRWDADEVRKKSDAEGMYHHSTWVEPGKEKDKSAYKFPHHYADGKNTLSPRGVAAAMAASPR